MAEPDLYTVGRYYFSPPGAQHYPGLHLLGSRNWYDGNHILVQGRGEDLTARHIHQNGGFAGPVPEQRSVGSAACIRDGEQIPADPAELINGYPPLCYVPLPPPPEPPPPPENGLPSFLTASAFYRCQTQRIWARVLDWLYEDDATSITTALTAFFTVPVTITINPVVGNYPATVIVVHPQFLCVVADGTRNAQQLAMQGFQSLGGPTNHGSYSTVGLWQQASAHIHAQINAAGVNDTRPVFLVGHSYGAAAVLVLAARYRFWDSGRTILYLTFGCPKPGDSRLSGFLESCEGQCMANDNDPITSIPPDLATAGAVSVLLPLVDWTGLAQWTRAPFQVVQYSNGALSPGAPVFLDFSTLFGMAQRLTLGQDPTAILGHGISEYERRILLRCPDAAWPVDETVWVMLEEDDQVENGLAFAGTPGTWPGSGTLVFGGTNTPKTPAGGIVFAGGNTPKTPNGGLAFGG